MLFSYDIPAETQVIFFINTNPIKSCQTQVNKRLPSTQILIENTST